MEKRGQVTLYIILGIILVAVVLLLIFFKDSIFGTEGEQIEQIALPAEIQNIQTMVDDCMQKTANVGVYIVAAQGGYLIPPIDSYRMDDGGLIAYAYDEKDTLVKASTIESELAKYQDIFLESCIVYENFPQFEITTQDPESSVIIKDELVDFETKYNIIVKSGTSNYKLKNLYNYQVPIRFGTVYTVAKKVVSELEDNPEEIAVANLAGLGFEIRAVPLEERNIMWTITDEQGINDLPFNFVFMSREAEQ